MMAAVVALRVMHRVVVALLGAIERAVVMVLVIGAILRAIVMMRWVGAVHVIAAHARHKRRAGKRGGRIGRGLFCGRRDLRFRRCLERGRRGPFLRCRLRTGRRGLSPVRRAVPAGRRGLAAAAGAEQQPAQDRRDPQLFHRSIHPFTANQNTKTKIGTRARPVPICIV